MTEQNIYKNLPSVEDIARERDAATRASDLKNLEPISFEELEKKIHEWMLVADTGIIKLLPTIIIANRLKGHDPIWTMLIGPSGGGKTEFLNMLLDLEDMYPISLLTPNTFLSGMYGAKDTSLLPQINNKILLFKDWTTLLSQNKDSRNEIFGQLREIYDGGMKKPFGNGKVAEWKGKVGLVAGVTEAFDLIQQMHTTLGERFINYRVRMPDRIETGRRAQKNGPRQSEMRNELRKAFYAFMKGIKIPDVEPELPEDVKEEIVQVSNFVTMARSGVIREFSIKREVIFVPAAEMPTRSVQQFSLLGVAFIIVNGGIYDAKDMNIIYRLALDSIPKTNYMVIKEMARKDQRTTAEIATDLGYPTSPIRMYLENLALLGVCTRIKGPDSDEGGNADRWTLKNDFLQIVKKYENIKTIEEKIEDEFFPGAQELLDLEYPTEMQNPPD